MSLEPPVSRLRLSSQATGRLRTAPLPPPSTVVSAPGLSRVRHGWHATPEGGGGRMAVIWQRLGDKQQTLADNVVTQTVYEANDNDTVSSIGNKLLTVEH